MRPKVTDWTGVFDGKLHLRPIPQWQQGITYFVQGMPTGPYPDYDREIHEVYLYSLPARWPFFDTV